jgi:hypothetical protein
MFPPWQCSAILLQLRGEIMNVQQLNHQIDYFIQRVRTGRIALPDFQRDFVWGPGQVVELLDSVSKQWPIGSLLMLNGPQPFAFRAIDSAPKIRGTELDLYILDGQQRVTALYHAVADVSKYCYYVDFNELAAGDGEPIRWDKRTKFEKNFPNLRARAHAGIALIKDVWDHPDFFSWLNGVENDEMRTKFIRLREDHLTGLQSKVYHMMAIELDQGIELEALARIFETINRTGVALNAFDLLVAKLYPTTFNLRNAWAEAQSTHDVFRRFNPSELEILKLVSLLIRRREGKRFARGVRQGDLLALESGLIIAYWPEAVWLYAKALYACLDVGVVSNDVLPSWAMVLGMAGCLLDSREVDKVAWWKKHILNQTFAQAANTKIVAEFDSFMAGEVGSLADSEEADPTLWLSKPARINGLFTKGMLALIVANGGRDPLTGILLSQCTQVAQRCVDQDGQLRKVGAEDLISNIILVADNNEKSIFPVGDIRKFENGKIGLLSQGIDILALKRTPTYMHKIFA